MWTIAKEDSAFTKSKHFLREQKLLKADLKTVKSAFRVSNRKEGQGKFQSTIQNDERREARSSSLLTIGKFEFVSWWRITYYVYPDRNNLDSIRKLLEEKLDFSWIPEWV